MVQASLQTIFGEKVIYELLIRYSNLGLSPAAAFLQSGLCIYFRPASLPVFCCWVSSSSRFVLGWLSIFMVRRFGGVVLSLSLVRGYSPWLLPQNAMAKLMLSLETFSYDVLLLFLLVVMQWWLWWWWCSGGGGDARVVVVMQGWWWCGVVVVVVICGRGGDSVLVGDFFWRLSLLFGVHFHCRCSCLSFGC